MPVCVLSHPFHAYPFTLTSKLIGVDIMSKHNNSWIELRDVSQSFRAESRNIVLFENVNLCIRQGESYAITGPSGSGKSSLLMLASGLEKPSTGSVVGCSETKTHSINELRSEIGFIFQQFHLLPELDALTNVALPLKLRGNKAATDIAKQWLEKVGLAHRTTHKPSQLSGGEQQRVAIARALAFSPKFIFADEPTGNLDSQSAKEIADLLFACCKDKGASLILVTHSEQLADKAMHQLHFNEGKCSWKKSVIPGEYCA